MKNADKNEIEILLRNLAKTKRAESVFPPNGERMDHLDADELNAFAAGHLPAATRALYVQHLADCDRCRRIVAQLAPASGIANPRTEAPAKETSRTFWADLFSARVMRYAIPALAVLILSATAVLWIKREPREFVARHTQSTPSSEVAATNPEPQESQSPTATTYTANKGASKPAATAERNKAETKTSSGAKETTKEKEEATPASASTMQPAAKAADAYAPPPPAKTETAAAQPSPAEARNEAAKQRPTTEPADRAATAEEDEQSRRDKSAAAAGRETAARRAQARTAVGGLSAGLANSATRTVAGRHFRQVENGWIDTAYASSMSLTDVARESEQYRALIGDEPPLRAVAEQLNGQVIVVWKGKAYRFR